MGRRYIVSDEGVSVTAASDLIQIKNASGSNKVCRIIRWWWRPTDNTLASAQGISTRCRRLPATVTDGSGGSTPTPRPLDGGDAAATFTALSNNTVKASTNGTAVILDEAGAHVYNGYEQQLEDPPVIAPAQSFVFELLSSSLTGTVHLSYGVEVEELG